MGTEVRVGEDKPRYDFYENALFLDDPIEADINRKARCRAPKLVRSQDSKVAQMRLIQDLNTSQSRNQYITHPKSLVSVIEED